MSILEESKKREWLQPVKSLAQKLYDKQVKDITNISDTEWFKEIKSYWKRVKDWANEELLNTEEKNLKIIQEKYKIASQFITFLNNLESSRDVRQQVKELW